MFCQYFFDFEIDSLDTSAECPGSGWIQYPADRWSCSPEQPLSGAYSLHHVYDNPDSGCDYIWFTHDPARSDSAFGCTFRVRHGYPPSSSNSWQVAVLATCILDTLPEGGAKRGSGQTVGSGLQAGPNSRGGWLATGSGSWIGEGIVLGVNLNGSDDYLVLWQFNQGEPYELFRTSLNYQEEVGVADSPRFSLKVGTDGKVSVYKVTEAGSEASLLGAGWLDSRPAGRQLVFRYRYSSAQDRKLWVDDVALTGTFIKDTLPPVLLSAEVVSGKQIKLIFAESPQDPGCLSFQLQWPNGEIYHPVTCQVEGDGQVWLHFNEEIPNREWIYLQLNGIYDRDGNCLIDTTISLRRNDAIWGDLVFNEVMADPDPPVRLPDSEYVELFNRSEDTLTLTGWQLAVNGRIHLIDTPLVEPGAQVMPGRYILITGINLPNEEGELILLNEHGSLVHAVKYAIPWKGPVWKQEGGWSLESPDPDRICGISGLWEYAVNPLGGTPGGINSLTHTVKDTEPPVLLYAGFRYNQDVFSLYFSETVYHSRWIPDHFPIISINKLPLKVANSFPFSDRIDLWLPGGVLEIGEIIVNLPVLTDCSGNLCRAWEAKGRSPDHPRHGSMMISEVMFAPREGAPEYIELYNPGPHYYDLLDLGVDMVEEEGLTVSPIPLSSHSRLVPPGSYLVLTKNVDHLMDAYHLEPGGKWVGVDSWRGLNNSGGSVMLTDRAGVPVDVAPYGDHMHMELLGDTRGVSLERIDFGTPGDDPDNWHSASSVARYATPGEPNSQQAGVINQDRILQVNPKVFSPDNDGFEDFLEIKVSPGEQGWAIQLVVTDLEGRRIRVLANNDLSGPLSTYRWDGESEAGRMVPEGIYILHGRGYHHQSGKVWRKRISLGVIYR